MVVKVKYYFTHMNGGRAYMIKVKGKLISIFENKDKDGLSWDDKIGRKQQFPTKIVEDLPVERIFLGDEGGKREGNTVLFKLSDKRYFFVSHYGFIFNTLEDINEFLSPCIFNDVPYPSAITDHYVYLLHERDYYDKKILDKNEQKLKDRNEKMAKESADKVAASSCHCLEPFSVKDLMANGPYTVYYEYMKKSACKKYKKKKLFVFDEKNKLLDNGLFSRTTRKRKRTTVS